MRPEVSNEITSLIKQYHTVAQIDKVYLFGSFAYGQPDAESDLDLCIITANNTARKRDLMKAMRKSISDVSTFPVDLLLYNSEEFYSRAGVASTIEHKIATEGVAVYGK